MRLDNHGPRQAPDEQNSVRIIVERPDALLMIKMAADYRDNLKRYGLPGGTDPRLREAEKVAAFWNMTRVIIDLEASL